MLEYLVDNIFVVFFSGKIFQQTVSIPMGTNCAPLLADIFLYSYEADFIQSLLSTGKKQLAFRFNLTFRYIDDVLSISNPDLHLSDRGTSKLLNAYNDKLLILKEKTKSDSCFYCDERGHNTDKCRHGMKIQCYNCGNVGHKYRNCRYYGMC